MVTRDALFLNILQYPLNDLLSLFRNCEVVLLGDSAGGVAHLVAEQVSGRILLGEMGAVGMAEIVVFEVYAKSFFDSLRVVFHRIDGLDLSVWQGVDELERGEGSAGCVGDDNLVLITYLCIGLIGGVGSVFEVEKIVFED